MIPCPRGGTHQINASGRCSQCARRWSNIVREEEKRRELINEYEGWSADLEALDYPTLVCLKMSGELDRPALPVVTDELS